MTPTEQAAIGIGWQRRHDGHIAGDGPDRWRWASPYLPGHFVHTRCGVTVDDLLHWLDQQGLAVMLVAAGVGSVVVTAIGDTPGTGHRAVATTALDGLARIVIAVQAAA